MKMEQAGGGSASMAFGGGGADLERSSSFHLPITKEWLAELGFSLRENSQSVWRLEVDLSDVPGSCAALHLLPEGSGHSEDNGVWIGELWNSQADDDVDQRVALPALLRSRGQLERLLDVLMEGDE